MTHTIKVDDSDVVFVGYGVVAPEYGWDDYKGVDVRGKTIVMLVNDPAVPDPDDPSQLDPAMFKGRAMTYYGRWTYKYEIASEKGAAAAPDRPRDRAGGLSLSRSSPGAGAARTSTSPRPTATPAAWPSRAGSRSTRPRSSSRPPGRTSTPSRRPPSARTSGRSPLGAKADVRGQEHAPRGRRRKNVVARLEGSDPKLKDEYVVYTAHWDHLGRDP